MCAESNTKGHNKNKVWTKMAKQLLDKDRMDPLDGHESLDGVFPSIALNDNNHMG